MHAKTIEEGLTPSLISESNMMVPMGLRMRVMSRSFKETMAMLPETLWLRELLLSRFILSDQ